MSKLAKSHDFDLSTEINSKKRLIQEYKSLKNYHKDSL